MAQLILKHDLRFESLAEVLRLFFSDVRRPNEDFSGVLEFEAFPNLRLRQDVTLEGVIQTEGQHGELVFNTKKQVPTSERRKEAKRQLYLALAALTGQEAPWGSLTGVRPTQLVESLLEEEKSIDCVKEQLLLDYGLCSEKVSLVLQTNHEEQALLRLMDPRSDMVYIAQTISP